MALIDDFKARFPEFADATVDIYLPILADVWPAYYGREYDNTTKEIVLNLIAHLLVMETSSKPTARQTVASKSVGSVSTSYIAPTQSGGATFDLFNGTKYGQRFLMLIGSRYGGVSV